MQTYGRQDVLRGGGSKKFINIADYREELGPKFFEWCGSVFKEGAWRGREKALIALDVAHVVQCPCWVETYTSTCLEKGTDEEQMMEAVHVSAAIKRGSNVGDKHTDDESSSKTAQSPV